MMGLSCEREIAIPSRVLISSASRASVQFGRPETGASSSGVATRNAASAFTGAGPAATRFASAETPPAMNPLRHSRPVSSRTPKACAICGLIQPESVSRIARVRVPSAQSAPEAIAFSAARCSSFAVTRDRPAMPNPPHRISPWNHFQNPLGIPNKAA